MFKLKIILIILLIFIIPFCACSPSSISHDSLSAHYISEGDSSLSDKDIESAEIIDETKHYKIVYLNFAYYYYIFDENYDIVKSDGPLMKQPRITMVDNHLIKFTLQTGTGLGTQWGYYCDTETGMVSEVYSSIYDQCNKKVAYGEPKKVVITDIFDNTKFYQEILNFKYPLSEMAEPIKMVKFIDDGDKVEVSYFTGVGYEEVKEVFDLT